MKQSFFIQLISQYRIIPKNFVVFLIILEKLLLKMKILKEVLLMVISYYHSMIEVIMQHFIQKILFLVFSEYIKLFISSWYCFL